MGQSLTTCEQAGGLWSFVAESGTARNRERHSSSRSPEWRRTWLFPDAISGLASILDAAIIVAAGVLAHLTRSGIEEISPPATYALLLAALAGLNVFQLIGLYNLDSLSGAVWCDHRLPVAWGLVTLVLLIVECAVHTLNAASSIWVGLWFVYGLTGLLLARLCLRYQTRRWHEAGHLARNVVIIGPRNRVHRLVAQVGRSESATQRLRLLGFFDDDSSRATKEDVAACPALGLVEDLWHFARRRRIDEVIIALPQSEKARISSLVKSLSKLPLTVRLCPDWIGSQALHGDVGQLGRVPMLTLAEQPLSGGKLLLKNFIDRALALVGFLVAAPLLLVIPVAIWLESRGPILYRQRRYGFNQEIIEVFKFRTMYADCCDHGTGALVVQATKNDPRITRVGRYLRRTSLDELPQLLNVLKGDMSLVGPRPHAVVHDEYYRELINDYTARHKVKPGITGWAQINGLRGETDTLDKMEKRVRCDLHYIANWSFWLDLRILLKTLIVGFVNPAAH